MRKIQIVCLGIFAAGVLLTGIGCGVSMAEYSSLQYGGEKMWGGEAAATKVMEFQLPKTEETVIIGGYQRKDLMEVTEIIENPEVPEGMVRCEVTYNEALVEPYLYFEDYGEKKMNQEKTGYAGALRVGLKYTGDEFGTFMEMKDIILQELKERQISSYQTVYVSEIKILVHPNTRPCLKEQGMSDL